MMKYLCICQKGNSRSVALAWLLKKEYRIDAIPVGIRTASHQTLQMLYDWADVIVLTTKRYENEIPEQYRNKLKIWHVGTDIWFKGFASDLIEKYRGFIERDNQ